MQSAASISFLGISVPTKYATLLLLVAQNTAPMPELRYSLVRSATPASERYSPSTAIFCNEVLKLIICVAVVMFTYKPEIQKDEESTEIKSTSALDVLIKNTIKSPKEMIKLAVPSLLYTIQNNLLFFALKNFFRYGLQPILI